MSRLVEIDINQIIANPYQPRTTFDKDSLTELSQSILEKWINSTDCRQRINEWKI